MSDKAIFFLLYGGTIVGVLLLTFLLSRRSKR